MKRAILLLLSQLLAIFAYASTGFNFSECSGSNTFEQQIEQYNGDLEKAVVVGVIPKGIKGLKIELISDKDVDIRLYGQNGDKIIHWPNGILKGPTLQTAIYQGVEITYSGYNGDGTGFGHEFIEINGTIPLDMTMKAFGYKAGYATVNYSWKGKEGCEVSQSGEGHFTQEIKYKQIILVGTIPKNIENLKVNLTSSKDIDIQLYDEDGTAIIQWPNGLLFGKNRQEINYHDMHIEWSGYNGDGTGLGHEYIIITGKTTRVLTMKVYGYQLGNADVDYKWGKNDTHYIPQLAQSKKEAYLKAINSARTVARTCGDYGYFEAVSDVEWNEKLYKAAYEHTQDMTIMNYFSHTGSGTESDWSGYALHKQSTLKDRIEYYNFYWLRYSENITAGTVRDTVEKAMISWLNSPSHCKNIMDPDVTKVGLAHVKSDKAYYTNYWTQNFARGN